MLKISTRFKQVFTHEDGWQFHASLQPIRDMKIYNDDFFPIRQILRVDYPVGVRSGQVVQESSGQRYLLADYDHREGVYTGFRAIPVNKQVTWTRVEPIIDQLTGEPKGSRKIEMGNIWAVSELLSRNARGSHILTREEVTRVLVGADVALSDLIDDRVVKEVNSTLGIRVLEVV